MEAIFIGGCARSGTTMLGSILGAGKNCFVTPESQFKELLLHEQLSISDLEKKLQKNFRLNLWQLDDIHLQEVNSAKDILPFLLQLYKRKKGIPAAKNIWVDHTPDNFELFSTLLSLFPNAKFVHIIRDSRGVASSILPLDWGPNDAIEAADWWLQKIAFGLSAQISNPANVFHVRYEDILLKPEETIRDLCHKIGIEYHPDMLSGDNSFLPDYTKKQHSLVGNIPQKDQVNSWIQKLSKKDLEIIEKKTGAVLVNFGYKITHFGKWKISIGKKFLLTFKRIFKEVSAKFKFLRRKKKALKGAADSSSK